MRLLGALVLLLAAAVAHAQACDLEYRFAYIAGAEPGRFEVTLAFDARGRNATRLRLTEEWAGLRDFHRALRDVSAVAPATVVAGEDGSWLVRHAASARVLVRYAIQEPGSSPGAIEPHDFYRPRISASHFHFFGHAALLQPDAMVDDQPVLACMVFGGLPPGWTFASSFNAGTTGKSPLFGLRTTAGTLRNAVFLGGDFRLLRRDVAQKPVWIAVRGSWNFTDERFADAAAQVIGAHRRFWRDAGFPDYLVTLEPNGKAAGSFGGTAVHQAFAMHAAADFAIPGPAFDHLIAHEHVHTWIPARIGALGPQEATQYWFSEGFTEYLAHRLQLASGLWSLADYAAALNRAFYELAVSSARTLTNAAAAERFWSDPAAQRLPYLRGEQLALLWARRLEARGTTLEAVLRELERPGRARPQGAGVLEALATARLQASIDARLPTVAARDRIEYIDAGNAIPVDSTFLGPCFTGQMVARARFELGFDMRSLNDRRLQGLVEGSAAASAGLRDGMRLAGWSVQFGEPAREAEIRVLAEDGPQAYRYFPAARDELELVEFSPRPGARDDAACSRWLETP